MKAGDVGHHGEVDGGVSAARIVGKSIGLLAFLIFCVVCLPIGAVDQVFGWVSDRAERIMTSMRERRSHIHGRSCRV